MDKRDKPKKAVALEYSPELSAPKVVATGKGVVADSIIKKAEENNIPIKEDRELVNNLINLDLGEQIPPELYEAIAHILAFVCDVDKFVGEKE